jgi:PAS domain-containing protein
MNQLRHQPPRSIDLFVGRIFDASPLMALALCISLATILWCILLARRQRSGLDKILTGLLGLIAIYEALRILKDSGFIIFPGAPKLEGWADFIIASLSLIAALILRVSSIDRATTKAQLRLVEANEKPVDLAKVTVVAASELRPTLLDSCPLATIAVDLHGAVTYWNAAAETLTGWTRDEVVGHPLPFSVHGPIINKSGNEVEAVFWTSPIQCANGTARGSVTLAADSSALHAAGISHSFGTPVAAR